MSTYTGTLINDIMAIVERTQKALCQGEPTTGAMSKEAIQAYWDLEHYAKPVLGQIAELARMDEIVAIASEITAIKRELRQPVYKEEREFSDFQLKQHLYGSDNSQG